MIKSLGPSTEAWQYVASSYIYRVIIFFPFQPLHAKKPWDKFGALEDFAHILSLSSVISDF